MARRKGKRPGPQPKRSRPATPPPPDNPGTAFPAPEQTPGQPASRSAFEQFQAKLVEMRPQPKKGNRQADPELTWEPDYLLLRAEGWDWRKAAYIAWAASPRDRRWPQTQDELATHVLGLTTARTIRKWREQDKRIDERVGQLQVEPLFRHRRDVIEALVTVASKPDFHAHADRRMFLEMTGDYKPKGVVALTGGDGGPVELNVLAAVGELDDDELARLIDNLQAGRKAGADQAGGGLGGETPAG